MDNKTRGLYPKYVVHKIIKSPNGPHDSSVITEPLNNWVFVLNPAKDDGALFALRAYAVWAERNGHDRLASDLREQIDFYYNERLRLVKENNNEGY